MGKVLDFDLFMQEHEKRTMDVHVCGETYTIPMEIPAIVPVMMARAEEQLNANEMFKAVMIAADSLFGKSNVDRMCANGMSANDLAALMEKVFAEINGTAKDEDAQEVTDEDGHVQTNKRRSKK